MAEPSYKEMPASRTAFAAGGGDERRDGSYSFARDRGEDSYTREQSDDRGPEADLGLDDSGIELDDDEERAAPERRPPSVRPRSSGVVPRNRDAEALRMGAVVAGKYRIENLIEQTDSFAIVQALHLGLEQVVTLKYLLPSASVRGDAVTRFLRAARTASQLQCEHVARIIDVGRTRSGVPFVVTEELSGWELDEVLRVRGPLPVQEAVEYVIQASEAIAEGHALGIVHGSVNLSNLVLTRRLDDSPLVKVLGFGASALPERRLLGEDGSSLFGASGFTSIVPYLAPEQIRLSDSLDERADVWALGALLHTLLTGSPPFRGKTAVELLAVVSADPPRKLTEIRDDISPDLEAFVLRCLEKDRGQRFGNLAEFALALQPFASGDAQTTVERITRMFGRGGTRPPPLPGRHAHSIVPVARPRPKAVALVPPPAAAGPGVTRWFALAAIVGGGAGAIGALLVGLSIRAELGTLVRETAPVAVETPVQPVVAPPAVQFFPATPLAAMGTASPVSAAPPARVHATPAAPTIAPPPATQVVTATAAAPKPAPPPRLTPVGKATPETTDNRTAQKPPAGAPAPDLFGDTK